MGNGLTKRKSRAAPDVAAGNDPFVCRDLRADRWRMVATAETEEQRPLQPDDLVALGLTLRQAEVLVWLAFGKTDAEIGNILGISPRTVSHTVGRVYRKLGVGTRIGATLRAVRAVTTAAL
ncbi:MAG: helix-turn-helix transcriptional regulator [Alphaproteobacteria bacterium]|nr:helix-turn-helix transcriptional regulator [Alphaproteobacteria bacterium]MDE1931683.1 helix-turn-helix transcriptional regulator [Alphaproteobacteria bacterium]